MQLSDLDSQTVYESFASPDGTAGYRAENGETGWLYFNPSGGSDDGTATVFLYWGAGVAPDPELDTPIGHVNVSALLSGGVAAGGRVQAGRHQVSHPGWREPSGVPGPPAQRCQRRPG
jgi:hypothetical protein